MLMELLCKAIPSGKIYKTCLRQTDCLLKLTDVSLCGFISNTVYRENREKIINGCQLVEQKLNDGNQIIWGSGGHRVIGRNTGKEIQRCRRFVRFQRCQIRTVQQFPSNAVSASRGRKTVFLLKILQSIPCDRIKNTVNRRYFLL